MESRGTSPLNLSAPTWTGVRQVTFLKGWHPLRTAATHHGHCLGLDEEGGVE